MTERPAPSTCRSCNASIYWTVTAATGKRMPVDAAAVLDGTLRLVWRRANRRGDRELVSEIVPREDRTVGTKYFTSHFATCVHAAQHRKPRTGS